jgi:hypothetical protein
MENIKLSLQIAANLNWGHGSVHYHQRYWNHFFLFLFLKLCIELQIL